MAFASFAAAFATLVFSAEARAAFGVEEAAAAVGPALARFGAALESTQRSLRSKPPPGPPVVLPAPAMAAMLAALGGAMAGLLAPAGVRWARSFALASAPPAFAVRLCGASTPALAAARAAFVVTAAAAAAPIAFPGFQAPLLIAAAALHAAALRPMAQAYLDAALVSWHELRHAAGVDVTLTLRVMHARFEAASRLLVKVATQLAAPGALALAAGVALALTPPGDDVALLPAHVRRAGASFLGAAACAAWVAAAAAALAAFRTGILKP